jgi:cob(I)alamin adenosyltransferase
VDEASAVVGWARATDLPDEIDAVLARIQEACFRLGAWLASTADADPGVRPIDAEDVRDLEATIDAVDANLPALANFILPGGSEGAARLHVARTVARRAERVLVELAAVETVEPACLAWLNRLSDLLFVLARSANANAGVGDVPWAPRRER